MTENENDLQPDTGLTCEVCGCKKAKKTTCPFAQEICGESVEMNLCDECECQRALDV